MINNDLKQAYKYALIAVLLWSTVATAFKIALSYISAEELLLYASLTSLVVLFLVLLFQKKIHLIEPHIRNNLGITLCMAVINPFLYYLILFKAYALLPAQEAQAINYTWALMLAFLSVPFLKQSLRFADIIAGIICYFGVLIIATKGEPFALHFSNLEGIVLALLSTILWSFYWIFNTKIKSDPLVALFSNFLLSVPLIVVYVLFTQDLTLPSLNGVLAAMYVGTFEMGITFLFWLKAMQITPNTSKIANMIFISPFLSLVFIYFIVQETIYASTLFGLLFIILGLIIQQKRSKQELS